MGSKVVILLMSIILVVGLRTREVKANAEDDRKMLISSHVHSNINGRGGHHGHAHARAQAQAKQGLKGPRSMKFNNDLMPLINGGNSLKIVNDLCASATYKDACIKSLSSLTPKCGNSPIEYFKSGLQLALDETTKASKLPTTIAAPQGGSNDKRVTSALETCTDLLEQAIDRLKLASDQVNAGDPSKTLKDPTNIFNVRLELGDVNTFATNCLDEFTEAEAPELQKTMQGGIVNAQQLAVNMLDIISTYNF